MNQELTAETLEEGRSALFLLERQLKERNAFSTDNLSEANSSRQPSSSDRRTMDQLPRLARLNHRSESLGLTVEELDDRGLLEGGGSVPHYYTSVKQKNRRFLELQPRSNRLQERGKEALSKLLNGLYHMIRVLSKRGLDLESYYRQRDAAQKGLVSKKQFLSSLKQLGLPFSMKELQDVTQQYLQSGTDQVDYVAFLKDARVYRRPLSKSDMGELPGREEAASLSDYSAVLSAVKRMLLEAAKSLSKQPDDVYRMFARWDTQGTGTVTATQFLRVLARLHLEMTDQDQDFLVELLDTNAMGRIDFDSLLVYCFGSYEQSDSQSPHGMLIGTAAPPADDAAGETLSAVSTEGNTSLDLKSTPSLAMGALRRPHTASLSRPYNSALQGSAFVVEQPSSQEVSIRFDREKESSTSKPTSRIRPLTASGRVAEHTFQQGRSAVNRNGSMDADELFLMDLPDDVIHGEENYLPHEIQPAMQSQRLAAENESKDKDVDLLYEDVDAQPLSSSQSYLQDYLPGAKSTDEGAEPVDHLVLLATQILATLRDIILARYRRGRSLQEIYRHFDRDNKQFFDAEDFIQATADLRIETSEKVANFAIKQMAIDGVDKVSFGEFKVFVMDADNKLLELNVQEQLATILEQQGREFQTWMCDVFWTEDETLNDSRVSARFDKASHQEFVAKSAFVSALRKIGLVLTSAEVSRLVDRFDIHGQERCSVTRFIRMVQNSLAWKHAESVLRYQDQAMEEGKFFRAQREVAGNHLANLPQLSEELISMCEYLGICVLSEQNMIWIAADALKAPLPVNWTAQKDSNGRTFFFNRLTNQSRWEHPLDPHFRKLRDKYRQSANENDAVSPARGFRLKSSMQPPGEDSFHAKSMGWQASVAGQRPNIESFAPQPFETMNIFSEGRGKPAPAATATAVERTRPVSALATGAQVASAASNPTMERDRPISAPYLLHSANSRNMPGMETAKKSGAPVTNPTSAVLNATRAVTEAIYLSGYYKSQPAQSSRAPQPNPQYLPQPVQPPSQQLPPPPHLSQYQQQHSQQHSQQHLLKQTGGLFSAYSNGATGTAATGLPTATGAAGTTTATTTAPGAPSTSAAAAAGKPRASSANKRSSRSAVDRALSVGRTSQHLLRADRETTLQHGESKYGRSSKLAEMYASDILEKLDIAMGSHR